MAKKQKDNSPNVYTWRKRLWIAWLSVFVFVVLLFSAMSAGLLGFMPSFEELENPKSNLASEVISADQELLGKYYIENRSNIHYSDLSPNLVNAIIATEDSRYEKHSGIDVKALFRVTFGLVTGSNKGGGSTITQQLAKNLFPRKANRTFIETVFIKLKEWITAIKLERNYTKEEIMAMYFNTVDFGSNSFGIKSAAKTFFNKSPKDLSIEESAMLVGMLKAPTWFNPARNPERAMKRREVVLHQMQKYDYLTEEQYDSLRVLPLDMSKFRVQDHTSGEATYFREYLRQIMSAKEPKRKNYFDKSVFTEDSLQWVNNPLYGWIEKNPKPDGTNYNLYKDGLKIFTTINSHMQVYAEEAIAEHLGNDLQPAFYNHWKNREEAPFDFPKSSVKAEAFKLMTASMKRSERYRKLKAADVSDDSIRLSFSTKVPMKVFTWQGERDTIMTPWDSIRYYKFFLQAGLMSVEPQTGFVRAYVGGINYSHFQFDHVKMAKRQVGSTFKPFVYTLAMQEGDFSPCTKIANIQYSIDLPEGGKWEPRNSNDFKKGEMVTLKEALANSINWISAFLIKRYSPMAVIKIARKMGVTSHIDAVPSISLGTPDLTLYEMTGAMNTFAAKGVYIEPLFVTRIEDKNGNVIARFMPRQEEAMSEETAFLMLQLMKGVVESGTGVRLRYKYGLNNPIAGKTGTTQNNSDGWFMGLTPDLVTGVWVGGEDRSIHFRSITLGQGANMALPIWALYMKKIYADPKLSISQGDFEHPSNPLSVEIDCSKYEAIQRKSDNKYNSGDF
ncbi:MAG: transglycosylase domain-containing protein [Lentimicrobiaceae bacterium]|nr:transglycosylase domain-containing protein [Lentimicrobiaceae bacterium]MCB9023662.1 transglycosylase domain-containing protein [Lentimicrobiaceae bacterium]HPG33044.1 transglycosylase domain-containing protein [Lentimicrobium sp.]